MKFQRRRIAIAVQVAVFASAAMLQAQATTAASLQLVAPNSLLAVDQNREQVINRLVDDFADSIKTLTAQSPELNVTRESLVSDLYALRADQLFAATLANNLRGVLSVINTSKKAAAQSQASGDRSKALGDLDKDLVYTPVIPCRLFDTRISQGGSGPIAAGGIKNFDTTRPGGNFASQGGAAASDCNLPAGVAAVAFSVTTLNQVGAGYITAFQAGIANPAAQAVSAFYQSGVVATDTLIVQTQAAANNKISILPPKRLIASCSRPARPLNSRQTRGKARTSKTNPCRHGSRTRADSRAC